MKTDEDNCWYNGRHELCKELYPGKYEWCSSEYHRCVECLDDSHCPSWKPHCDWDRECEECLVNAHCPEGESCRLTNDRWVCRREDCVDLLEQGFPNYCRDRFPATPVCEVSSRTCVECIGPSDCDEGYVCIDKKCKREEDRDCIDLMEIGITDFCAKNSPNRPVCHTFLRDCVECQFDPQCKDDEICANAKCIPKEWECEGPEDCLSERFKCVEHKCVKKICSDYDDPDAFCDEYRSDWRCFEGVCVRCIDREDCKGDKKCMDHKCVDKTCDEYKQPDIWCWQKYGDGYKCVNHECVQTLIDTRKCSDFLTTAESVIDQRTNA
jgi:Cys-rich repeat protein